MVKSVEQLLRIQECDLEIVRLQREMQDIPLRKQQMESALDAQKEGLAQAERKLLEVQTHIQRAESEIDAARQQIRKFRDQQLQIKSNDEYRALEKQIATALEQISALEDNELASMEEVERARGGVALQKAALDKQTARVQADVNEFMERSGGLDAELKAQQAERATRAADMDRDWLSRYERLFSRQHEAAVVVIEHGTCGHCHMRLAPSQIVEARRHDQLVFCDFCGHILYAQP